MDFKMEVRKGYSSIFNFKWKICGTILSCILTENENEKENLCLKINQTIQNGSLAIGI